MRRPSARRMIGIAFVVLALLTGAKVFAVVTAVPEPPLPLLLQSLEGVGGDTTVCPPETEQQAASRRRLDSVRMPAAWSPELGRRLDREFPPGSDAKQVAGRLQTLGFRMLGSCKGDPTVRSAIFQQHGGFPLGNLPMIATVWWQVDAEERLIWAKGMVGYDGL